MIIRDKSYASGNLNPEPSASRPDGSIDLYFNTWPKLLLCALLVRGCDCFPGTAETEWGNDSARNVLRTIDRVVYSHSSFCHGVTNPYLILELSFGPFLFAESLNTQTLGESGPMPRASTGRRTCHRHEDTASSRNASRGVFMHACLRVTVVGWTVCLVVRTREISEIHWICDEGVPDPDPWHIYTVVCQLAGTPPSQVV